MQETKIEQDCANLSNFIKILADLRKWAKIKEREISHVATPVRCKNIAMDHMVFYRARVCETNLKQSCSFRSKRGTWVLIFKTNLNKFSSLSIPAKFRLLLKKESTFNQGQMSLVEKADLETPVLKTQQTLQLFRYNNLQFIDCKIIQEAQWHFGIFRWKGRWNDWSEIYPILGKDL